MQVHLLKEMHSMCSMMFQRSRRFFVTVYKRSSKYTVMYIFIIVTFLNFVHLGESQKGKTQSAARKDCLWIYIDDVPSLRYSVCSLDATGSPTVDSSATEKDELNNFVGRSTVAVLDFKSLLNELDLFGVIQQVTKVSDLLLLLLPFKDDILSTETLDGMYQTHTPGDVIHLRKYSQAWWEMIFHASGLKVERIFREQVPKRTCMQVRAVYVQDPCRCRTHLKELHTNDGLLSSCALVMSSGLATLLKAPRLGALIDSHAAVFRQNHAPAAGIYTSLVGAKTSYRLLYPHSKTLKHYNGERLLFSIYYKAELRLLKTAIAQKQISKSDVTILPRAFRNCASHCIGLKQRHCSTGILATVLSLSMCKRVTIFGKSQYFDSFDVNTYPYHYFEENHAGTNISAYFSDFHDTKLEKIFYSRLSQQGVVFVP